MDKIELFVIISMIGTCESGNEVTKRSLRRGWEPFIVGGSNVKIEDAPHSVFLQVDCKGEDSICGSSVLTQSLLLTAAHCVADCCGKKFQVTAHAGHADLLKCKMKRKVKRILVHETFCSGSMLHDIALAFLEKPLLLGRNVQRVSLPNRYLWSEPFSGTTTGWGITDHKGKQGHSKVLKSIQMSVQPSYVCTQYMRKKPGVMCAGNPKVEKAPSGGDSGGALIIGKCIQVGIVSFTHSKNLGLVFYTNVTYFYNWILRSAKKLTCTTDYKTKCVENYC